MTTVRYSPPWDVAKPAADPVPRVQQLLQVNEECLAAWLVGRQGQPGRHQRGDRVQTGRVLHETARGNIKRGHTKLQAAIPSLRTYPGAVQQFLDDFTCGTPTCPDKVAVPGLANNGLGMAMAPVTIIAPWGEPDYGRGVYEMPSGARDDAFDNPACPKKATVANCGPELAVGMYNYVRQHCTTCAHVIAGDFGSGASAHPGRGRFPEARSSVTTCACTTGTCVMPKTSLTGAYTRTATWSTRRSCGGTVGTTKAARRCGPRADTRVYSLAAALKQLNLRNSTKIHIWLDEISSFNGKGQGNNPYPYFTPGLPGIRGPVAVPHAGARRPGARPDRDQRVLLGLLRPGSTNAELIKSPGTSYPVYGVFKAANN